jgi:hypothetical protein
MLRLHSLSWIPGALVVVALVTACGGGRGEGSADMNSPDDGAVAPVVTSVVGLASPGGAATTRGTTTATARQPTTTAATNFGESTRPITVPTTRRVSLDSAAASAAEAAARAFLERYWVREARTSAQVADAIAPYATDRLLAIYRDPTRADRAEPGTGVGDVSVQVTEATPTTAVAIGQGTLVDEPTKRVTSRTLNLVRGSDGAWRVEAIR